MIILSPIHYQTFLEIRNTAWCVTVPILEYTLAMSKFIKQGVVTRKLTSATNTTGDSPPSSKKDKKQSSNQADNSADSAMVASTVNTYRSTMQKQSDSNQPQKCKHCGKFVIYTDGICDVYNVPSVHMASSGIRDTQTMSVIFNNTNFEDQEYMFANERSGYHGRPNTGHLSTIGASASTHKCSQ
jgi:hypothetical protein